MLLERATQCSINAARSLPDHTSCQPRSLARVGFVTQLRLIDVGLVGRLQPQWIDRWPIGAAGPSQQMADVYQVEIEITNLQIREFTAMLAAIDGQRHEIILGRTQLRSCTLMYDGPKGTVSLSR